LIFWYLCDTKIVERIKNDKVVQGDRLDSVNPVAVSEGQLLKIGPAPKFELINQDSKKIPMKHTKESICVRIFFTTCYHLSKMNQSMLVLEKNFLGTLISDGFNNHRSRT
jgi:protein SCO1/2